MNQPAVQPPVVVSCDTHGETKKYITGDQQNLNMGARLIEFPTGVSMTADLLHASCKLE